MRLNYLSVVLIILVPVLLFFQTRGVVIHDEGYILYSSEKLLNGILPYRDFDFVYTPLSLFLTSLSFKFFGISVLSSRILMILIALLASYLLFKIVFYATKNKVYATLSVFLFVAWGPAHTNFSWPDMFAIPTALLSVFLLMQFLNTRKGYFLFFAGFAAFFVFLAKQNFGAAMLIPYFSFFLIKHARNIRYVLNFSYGYLWGVILFGIYLLSTDSFAPFISNFYHYTIKRVIINESLTTPYLYVDTFFRTVTRVLLYSFPLLVAFFAFIILFIRRRFHLLFLPVFVASFYVVGIRPTTDYIHLTPLLALSGIVLSLIIRYSISSYVRLFVYLCFFGLIITGFYSALFRGYYRWDEPLTRHNSFYKDTRVMVFTTGRFYNEMTDLVNLIRMQTKPSDYIYVNSYNPLIYFLSQRPTPLNKEFLGVELDPESFFDEVVGNLVAKEVKVVIIVGNSVSSLPFKDFLLKNYYLQKSFQDFDLYLRKP